jgi:hypothetical protein
MQPEQSHTWMADIVATRGLDGVIATIVDTLARPDHWCVEFGAWDGLLASNTRNLIAHHGYSAVLIEADSSRFRELERLYIDRTDVTTINAFVGFDRSDGLDAILARTSIPREFDFLSIDIDGNDYHVWRAVTEYRPKVVCIEFNTTIPPEVSFVQPADPSVAQGSSLAAIVELAAQKGYQLIFVESVNAFFVSHEYYDRFGIRDNSIGTLWTTRDDVTYLFSGYDGTLFLRGCRTLPWYCVDLSERRIQHVPRFLRGYPYPKWGRWCYLAVTDPAYLAKRALIRFHRRFGHKI